MKPLTVPGTLDSLGRIREYVRAAAQEAGLERKRAYRLELAIDEVATNIVVHGYNEGGCEGDIDLFVEMTEASLAISIEDTARPFDSRAHALPVDLDSPLEQRSIGGLGVYLAVKNVDEFLYARVGERNRNTFVVKRGDAVQAAQGS